MRVGFEEVGGGGEGEEETGKEAVRQSGTLMGTASSH